jgi:UPF0176 protein
MNNYLILLYYHYTTIEDPEQYRKEHLNFCIEYGLRGRIIVAREGINGTVSGTAAACNAYIKHLKADERFSGIEFKSEPHGGHAFEKINVRVKPEIVHSGLPDLDPRGKTGKHIQPEEFIKLKDRPDTVLLDVRSEYEHKVGRFKHAITLDIQHFRQFPEKLRQLEHLKEKTVITYCTGGIKCEKASAYLLEQGFKNVYQLHGGIIQYGLETGGADFEGKCYVFDNRVVKEVNHLNPTTVGTCQVCGESSDRMINCANPECNAHIIMCISCSEHMQGACSETCRDHPKKRPYNDKGYYSKKLNGYNPYIGHQ